MTKGEIVDHLSLIVIDANNRCWKPCLLYVTLVMVTMHLDWYTDDDGHGSHAFGVGARWWSLIVMPLGLMPDDGHGNHASGVDALTWRRCLGSLLEMMWSLVKPEMPLHVPMKKYCGKPLEVAFELEEGTMKNIWSLRLKIVAYMDQRLVVLSPQKDPPKAQAEVM